MLRDKLLERHRRPSSDLLDEVIRAREEAVLVIDRDLAQVLDQEGVAGRKGGRNEFLRPSRDVRTGLDQCAVRGAAKSVERGVDPSRVVVSPYS